MMGQGPIHPPPRKRQARLMVTRVYLWALGPRYTVTSHHIIGTQNSSSIPSAVQMANSFLPLKPSRGLCPKRTSGLLVPVGTCAFVKTFILFPAKRLNLDTESPLVLRNIAPSRSCFRWSQ